MLLREKKKSQNYQICFFFQPQTGNLKSGPVTLKDWAAPQGAFLSPLLTQVLQVKFKTLFKNPLTLQQYASLVGLRCSPQKSYLIIVLKNHPTSKESIRINFDGQLMHPSPSLKMPRGYYTGQHMKWSDHIQAHIQAFPRHKHAPPYLQPTSGGWSKTFSALPGPYSYHKWPDLPFYSHQM